MDMKASVLILAIMCSCAGTKNRQVQDPTQTQNEADDLPALPLEAEESPEEVRQVGVIDLGLSGPNPNEIEVKNLDQKIESSNKDELDLEPKKRVEKKSG